MKRNLYTKEEIILCTFIARFGKNDFDESDIYKLKNRSISSIKMKIQNIAAMLDEEGFETSNEINKLSGKPTDQKGRRTNWDVVGKYATKDKPEFLDNCLEIIATVS